MATVEALANAGILLKAVGNTYSALAKVDTEGKPLAGIPVDVRMVFFLDPVGSEFLSVTNLDPAGLKAGRLYFSNVSGNATKEDPDGAPPDTAPIVTLNLSAKVAEYLPLETYLPGDLARFGDLVFECIKAGAGNRPDAEPSEHWASRGKVQYVSKRDLLPVFCQVTTFKLKDSADGFRIRVFGMQPASNLLARLVLEDSQATPGEPSNLVQVNLQGLPPGRYRVNINGEDFEAYFNDEAKARGAFGVVEIFNHLPTGDDFSLIGDDGALRQPTFVVRFANRRAYWKYLTPSHKVQEILVRDAHDEASPFKPGTNPSSPAARKDFFVSKRPLLLTEIPSDNRFDLMVSGSPRPAPKPNPAAPGMLTRSIDEDTGNYLDFICDIPLNY
jgi:hypothetical protein